MSFASIFKISLLSTVPISILIAINQDRLLKIKLRSAMEELNRLLQKGVKGENISEKEKISLVSESGKDKFEKDLDDLLFIRSANNYVEIFYKGNEKINKVLLRSSLQKVEDSTKGNEDIYKCHRTCLVNIKNIKKLTGNSQAYRLIFENIDEEIPVSRNYSKELLKLINNH